MTGSPTFSARIAVAADSRPSRTKPSAGMSSAPVPLGLTETTTPLRTSTSATSVAPCRPRARGEVPHAFVKAIIESFGRPCATFDALMLAMVVGVPLSVADASTVRSTIRAMPSFPTPMWPRPPASGDLISTPLRTSPPCGAVELPMSKNSPLTPATAPAWLAATLSGPPSATLPAISRSEPTAGLARSTVRICESYQPPWSRALT